MVKSPRVLAATIVTGVIGTTAVWLAPAASAATGPIAVTDPNEVPAAAIEDVVSTYLTESTCDTTRSWVLTTAGQRHDATSHVETRWSQEIPGVPAEYRYLRTIEGQEHAAVTGHRYTKVVKGHEATASYQYKKNVTYYTVEHKMVRPNPSGNGWTDGELAWLNKNASAAASTTDRHGAWTLSDEVVNQANVNPFNYPQGSWQSLGSLGAYGYSGQSNGGVQYFITKVEASLEKPTDATFYQTQSGVIYYTGGDPNTGFSAKAGDVAWVTVESLQGWTRFAAKSNDDAVADQTLYYDGSAVGTTHENLAVAVSNAPGGEWVQDGDPVVIEAGSTDPDVTLYYTGAGGGSADASDAVYTATDPGGDWTQDGGALEGTGTVASTVYYNAENPADTTDASLDEGNWTTFSKEAGPEGWTFVDDREVLDVEAYDDPVELTTYVWSDGVLCTPETPETPGPVDQSDEAPTTPAVPAVATASGDDVEYDELAHTGGAEAAPLLLPGIGSGLLGAGMLFADRRRRQR